MELGLSKNMNLGLPKQPSPVQNFLIEAVLLLVVCGLFTWYIILPKRAENNKKREVYVELSNKKDKIKKDAETLLAKANELKERKDDVEKLDRALPLTSNAPQLEIIIQKMASDVSVELGAVNISGVSEKYSSGDKEFLANPFKVQRKVQKASGDLIAKGTLNQLMAFLHEVEASGRLINVQSIEIGTGTEGGLVMKLSVLVYVFAA